MVLGQGDGVGTAVFDYFVGKDHVLDLGSGRRSLGDDLEVVDALRVQVAVFDQITVQGGLHRLGPVLVLLQPKDDTVLLGEEQVEHPRPVVGS